MINNRVLSAALVVAALAFATGATINTLDWRQCLVNRGGVEACSDALNRATTAWSSFAMSALALATNILKQND